MFAHMLSLIAVAALMLFGSGYGYAHHSGANFDRSKQVQLAGEIRGFEFKNPHVYIEVAVDSEQGAQQIWLIEGHSVTGATRLGWSTDSLAIGEKVAVIANPDRDPGKRFAILDSLQKTDGSFLYAYRKPKSEQSEKPPEIKPAQDFSGTWELDLE